MKKKYQKQKVIKLRFQTFMQNFRNVDLGIQVHKTKKKATLHQKVVKSRNAQGNKKAAETIISYSGRHCLKKDNPYS